MKKNITKLIFKSIRSNSYNNDNIQKILSKYPNVKLPIYLDAQSTTKTDPRVCDAMIPYFLTEYGNPHSRTHIFGWTSEKAIEEARKNVAKLIGANSKEIIFTSGATESNNMAIKGVMNFYKNTKKHIITLQTEHKCVLDSCRYLQDNGFSITYLPVNSKGLINLKDLENAITPLTGLISIMLINNEIGVIQPIEEIGNICRKHKIFFHCDAAQAYGKIPIDVEKSKIDLMSISSHKIYGPKGIGALYIRTKPRVRLIPLINGGGQERGLRSGTLPTPIIVGFGKASEIANKEMNDNFLYIKKLSNILVEGIKKMPNVIRNGDEINGFPGCINYSFHCVEGESLLMALKEIALSSGSACTSASLEPSYVLRAIGAEDDLAHSSIRFGISKYTKEDEIKYLLERLTEQVKNLREMSPLWEMVQEGIDLKSIDWKGH